MGARFIFFSLKYMHVQLFSGSLKTKENYLYRSENIFGVLSVVALRSGIYMEIGDHLMVIYGNWWSFWFICWINT